MRVGPVWTEAWPVERDLCQLFLSSWDGFSQISFHFGRLEYEVSFPSTYISIAFALRENWRHSAIKAWKYSRAIQGGKKKKSPSFVAAFLSVLFLRRETPRVSQPGRELRVTLSQLTKINRNRRKRAEIFPSDREGYIFLSFRLNVEWQFDGWYFFKSMIPFSS